MEKNSKSMGNDKDESKKVEMSYLFPIRKEGKDWEYRKWGYIDKDGNVVIKPKFHRACRFSEGLAAVMIDEKKETEEWKMNHTWEYIKINHVLAEGIDDEDSCKWGYIDIEGKLVVPLQFAKVHAFSEGLAAVRYNTSFNWGYIDKEGKMVIQPQLFKAESFSEGLAAVEILNEHEDCSKWGYIDKEGKFVIQPQFDEADSFSEGLAVVRIGDWDSGKYGYINKEGKMVIQPQFDEADSFSEGLAAVKIGDWDSGKYGYIDKEGKMVIQPQFDMAHAFSEGLATVRVDDYIWNEYSYEASFYINKEGKMIVGPFIWGATIYNFTYGLAEVTRPDGDDYHIYYINKEGEDIWTEHMP